MDSNVCVAKREGSCYQFVRGPHDGIASDACPTLKTTEMSVPNDVPLRIEMQFDHLPSFYHGSHLFWCLVHIEEAKFKVSGRMVWENSTVVCDETIFNYNAEVAEIQATVSVLVNKNADLLDSRTITVYKCSVLGSYKSSQDCTLCIAHRSSYGCTWCQEGCVSKSRCSSNFTECPGPEIFSIRPRSGPIEGGTVLTIEGSNLGTSVQDLRGKIKIGSRDCSLLSLKNSVEATCLTPQSVPRERNVSVTLFTNRGPVLSPAKFAYTDFFITNFSPTKGSISGGTKIRILGRNLDVGTSTLAYLDEVPCRVDRASITSDSIVCTTSYVAEERVTQNMTLVIDGAVRQLRAPFFYTPNPIVHNIRPLTSIYSGGRILSVHGEYFDSIGSAGLLVYDHDGVTSFESACKILSGRLMECVTPPLHKVLGKSTLVSEDAEPEELHIGLRMDNATGLLHLSSPHSSRPDLVLHYVRDPLYSNFSNNLKVYKGDELVIEGSRLNVASDQNDVRVMIGSEFCNITSLTSTQLLCVPPAHQPPPDDDDNGDLPQVKQL
jgi:plexin A